MHTCDKHACPRRRLRAQSPLLCVFDCCHRCLRQTTRCTHLVLCFVTAAPGSSMAASERAASQGAALAMDPAGLQSPPSEGGSSDGQPASTVGSLLGPTQVGSPSETCMQLMRPASGVQ